MNRASLAQRPWPFIDRMHLPPESALSALRERILALEARHARVPGSVGLVAVSKTRTAAEVARMAEAGQRDFGENYLQEAAEKQPLLLDRGLVWHFIGPVQSNKTAAIARAFDWVHTVDRLKIAERLSAQRPDALPPLEVCLQVNVSGEATKSGVAPEAVAALAAAVAGLPRIRLRGLMTLPEPVVGVEAQRPAFRRLAGIAATLRTAGLAIDTLSMGTSADLEAAIAEGATWVRVGTALFGPREPSPEVQHA